MVTRGRNKVLIAVGVAALLSMVLGSLPSATAQEPATEQFVCNDRISIQVAPAGQLNFGAFPGPDCRATASSFPLSFTWPGGSTSYTTVRIDGTDQTFDSGSQVTPPTIVGNDTIITTANFGEVEVSQLVQIVQNPTTGEFDAALVSYTVQNVSQTQAPHNVGIRFFLDTKVGDSDNPVFFVNDQAVTTEREYVGNVPDMFSVQDPSVSTQAADGTMGAHNTTPDRFVIGQYSSFAGSLWDYVPNQSQIFDSAFGSYWETPQLTAGATVTYSMTYGVGLGGRAVGGGEPIPGCEGTDQRQCGTTGDDTLSSSDGHVVGGDGDDTITLTVDESTNSLSADGGAGADQIILNIEDLSSEVDVKVNAGGGADQVLIPKQPGNLAPVLKTGGGNDVVKVLSTTVSPKVTSSLQISFIGRYLVNAGGGADRVTVGLSDDEVNGAAGNDKINGASGDDEVEGGGGNDDMLGGEGGDVLHGGDGANDFAGGPGRDTCLSDTRKDDFSGCERIRRNHRRNHQQL